MIVLYSIYGRKMARTDLRPRSLRHDEQCSKDSRYIQWHEADIYIALLLKKHEKVSQKMGGGGKTNPVLSLVG